MTKIGIIGSGNIGGTVARLAVSAGHEVIVSNSREPSTLAGLVAELGPTASAGTPADAVHGDLVLVSIPLKAYGRLTDLDLSGKVVMDTGNYYPDRDGPIAELTELALTESEYLERHVPGALVVKVFNNIYFKHLGNLAKPGSAAERTFLPIAGGEGKEQVIDFLDSIGYGAVDSGPLPESWRQQPGTPVYGEPYGPFSDEQGRPADAETITAALAAATR